MYNKGQICIVANCKSCVSHSLCVVELQIAATGLVQCIDFLPIASSQVAKEVVQIWVGFFRDCLSTTSEVQHGGGRDGDLDGTVLISC